MVKESNFNTFPNLSFTSMSYFGPLVISNLMFPAPTDVYSDQQFWGLALLLFGFLQDSSECLGVLWHLDELITPNYLSGRKY